MRTFWRRKWVRAIMVLAGLWLLVRLYNADLLAPAAPEREPLLIAHRGFSAVAPENTLASIRKALEADAPMIEFDVHLSRDKVAMLLHDPTLDRTTNGSGPIRQKSLIELRQLDAGSWFDSAFAGERIPTLTEVLALVQGRSRLLIELKWDEEGHVYPGLVDTVLAELDRFQARDWCVIQSFDAGMVREAKAKAPDIEVQKLIFYDLPIVPGHVDRQWQWTDGSQFDADIAAINVWVGGLSPRLVNRIHAQGKKVYVYTVNESEDVAYCKKLGVDGLITDGQP